MATARYKDSDLVLALTQVAQISSGLLSVAKYDSLRTVDQPSSALIVQRMGSWGAALTAAGLASNQCSRSYRRKFEPADAVRWTKKYLATTAKPSYQEFSQWLQQQPDAPSAQTCRNLTGSWQALINKAKN